MGSGGFFGGWAASWAEMPNLPSACGGAFAPPVEARIGP